MPNRSTDQANANVIARLKLINGSTGGYWTNLENRVFNRLWLPEDRKAPLPYACVVMADDDLAYEFNQGDLVYATWTLKVFGFAPETTTKRTDGDGPRNIARLHDDVLKALLSDWTFDGAVDDSTIVGGTRSGGVLARYGEMSLDLRLKAYLSVQGLGP